MMGAFLDRLLPPSREEIAAAVGEAFALWDRLEGWVATTYGLAGEPIFFGRDSGWCLRFRRSGKALLTLLPHAGGFQALVVVGPSAWGAVATADLSPAIREAWDRAKPYPDGRWLWPEVVDASIAADIERLIALKSPPPRRVRRPVVASPT